MNRADPIDANGLMARRRGRFFGTLHGFLLLAAIAFVPAIVFYVGVATSLAPGAALLAIMVLGLRAIRPGAGLFTTGSVRVALAFVTLVLLHRAFAGAIEPGAAFRSEWSALAFSAMILAASALALELQRLESGALHRAIVALFLVYCVSAFLAALGLVPEPLKLQWRLPIPPFSEPSHFALLFAPLALYVGVATRGRVRLLLLVIGVLSTLAVQNLTLVVVWALVAGVVLSVLRFGLVGAMLVPLLLASDLSYYADRLGFLGNTSNLSALVYLQGWQLAGDGIERTGGWGLGFQQLGIAPGDVPASQLIRLLRGGHDMNLLDGGFLGAKLLGEFGVSGVLAAIVFLLLGARSALALRKIARSASGWRGLATFAHCVVLGYTIEVCVRSAGYFTGSALLAMAAIHVLVAARVRPGADEAVVRRGRGPAPARSASARTAAT